jgi:1-acyl-sn-glycerol-3-phosphate acyltransferase
VYEILIDPLVSSAIDSLPNRLNEFGYDPWGFHPEKAKPLFSVGKGIYEYFRPEIHGIENIPAGRVLLVPNHAGQLPFDGLVILMACLLHGRPPRLPRAMAERFVPRIPFVSEFFARSGVVVGDPFNCRNLLLDDNAILVFPEGARGSGKVWRERYKLRPFGRGFMRLALQTETPVVPVAVIGSEEAVISVHNFRPLARLFGAPYFPINPLLPLLGPLAYFPLPVKFHVYFGEPMRFEGPFDDEDTVIDAKVKQVQVRVQQMIDRGLAARTAIFS